MAPTTGNKRLSRIGGPPSTPKKRRTTDADWIQHKPKLRRLYIEEKKTKKEVVQIMHDEDGLNITEKQVKYLFETKWKIPKNRPRTSKPRLQSISGKSIDFNHLPAGDILPIQSLPVSGWGEASISTFLPMPRTQQETTTGMLGSPLQTAAVGLLNMLDTGGPAPTFYHALSLENVPAGSLEREIMSQNALGRSTALLETFHHSLPDFQSSSTAMMLEQSSGEAFSEVFDTLSTSTPTPFPVAAFMPQSNPTASCRLSLASTCLPTIDPETIIIPLQKIRNHVFTGFNDNNSPLTFRCYGRLHHQLRKALSSDWVLDALRVVLRWAYRGAEKKIAGQHRQWHAGKADAPEDDQLLCMSTEDTDRSFVRKADGMLEIRPRIFNSDGDVFRAGLYRAFKSHENEGRGMTEMVSMTYVPNPQWHSTGLSITIGRAFDTRFRASIPPSIRAFNVVPWDAEIIRLVKKNDLRGVRELFETRKASPTDVNPDGHSLLSYAIYPGAAELFELLLRGGADVWHCCTAYDWDNTIDLISAIWQRWSTDRCHRLCARTTDEDCFDETAACIRLTNIAFDHGCEINLCTSGDPDSLSPLFEIAWQPSLKSAEYMEAIASLIGNGLDKDERNNTGQTPFLFAVVMPWSTAALPRALVSYKVDLAAVDNFGRGAFHSAILHASFQYRLQVLKENSKQENALRLSAFGKNNVGGQRLEDAVLTDDDKQPTAKDIDWHKWIDDLRSDDYCDIYCSGYWPRSDEPRVYSTLLFLFEVGCDPNLKDRDGLVPSDYVRGLPIWSTWEKALTKSGWFYDARSKQCIKRIQTANEDVHEIEDESDLEIGQFAQVGRQNHTEEVLNDFDPPLEGWPLPDDCTTGHESLEFPNVFTLCSPMPGVEEI